MANFCASSFKFISKVVQISDKEHFADPNIASHLNIEAITELNCINIIVFNSKETHSYNNDF